MAEAILFLLPLAPLPFLWLYLRATTTGAAHAARARNALHTHNGDHQTGDGQ